MTATHITDAEIAELRAAVEARSKIRTHYEGCWLWDDHCDCAIHRLLAEIERLRAELHAVDTAIDDRGVPEVDCTLPLPERVSNIISELKEWRYDCATEAMENERLRAEVQTAFVAGADWLRFKETGFTSFASERDEALEAAAAGWIDRMTRLRAELRERGGHGCV